MNTYRPDANWSRSSFCGASAGCVDVRRDGDKILVRDSKVAPEDALVLSWSVDEWRELLDAIRRGTDHDDLTEDFAGVWIGSGHYLFFGPDEWAAFVKGVKAGEFDVDRLSSPVPVSGGLQVDGANEVGVGGGSNQTAATGAGAIAVPPVPVAAPWDPTSPQHAVIRAAVNWRKRIADAIARGAARVEVWADREDLALIEAVDGLPHIGEPAAPVAADDLLVCGHRAPYGRGPKSVESPCGQCGTWRAYAGPTRAESALRPGGENGDAAVPPVPVAAKPVYILDKDAILELVERYGEACLASDWEQAAGEFDAIRGALTPVPNVEPEPRWGAGPLVKHVPETSATPEVWSGAVAPGGYVCGALDPNRPDGICGMPVESEPCSEHNAEPLHIRQIGSARHNLCGEHGGEARPLGYATCPACLTVLRAAETPGTGSAVPDLDEIKRRDRLAESWAEVD